MECRFKVLAVKKNENDFKITQQVICSYHNQLHVIHYISSLDFCFVTGNDLCATADIKIKRGNLIHGLMEHLMSSALSGKLVVL